MVYRAREVGSGRRIVLKAYDSLRLTPSKRTALDRHLRALRAAQSVCGTQDGVVVLERVVQDSSGMFLVMQACNGRWQRLCLAKQLSERHASALCMVVPCQQHMLTAAYVYNACRRYAHRGHCQQRRQAA
jgi:hypothetical protein